jgi:DNA-binding transcriptional MerR regulator
MGRPHHTIFEEEEFDEFKSISQVANEIGVEQHILRFWENKFPQIQPIKARGKRRLYSPNDIDKIREIKILLYDKRYTIEGAQKHLTVEKSENKEKEKIVQELKSLRKDLAALLY